jgi:hypothetical protein
MNVPSEELNKKLLLILFIPHLYCRWSCTFYAPPCQCVGCTGHPCTRSNSLSLTEGYSRLRHRVVVPARQPMYPAWRAGATTLCQSRLSPQSGTKNLATVHRPSSSLPLSILSQLCCSFLPFCILYKEISYGQFL